MEPVRYLGLSEEAAMDAAYEDDFDTVRIVARDGKYLAVTRDYRKSRINFRILNNTIIGVYVG